MTKQREEGEGRRVRTSAGEPCGNPCRSHPDGRREEGEIASEPPPPHPSIIRNPIKEFCEQMAISHRRQAGRQGNEVGGNGGRKEGRKEEQR